MSRMLEPAIDCRLKQQKCKPAAEVSRTVPSGPRSGLELPGIPRVVQTADRVLEA
jgi:hypothetical protein